MPTPRFNLYQVGIIRNSLFSPFELQISWADGLLELGYLGGARQVGMRRKCEGLFLFCYTLGVEKEIAEKE